VTPRNGTRIFGIRIYLLSMALVSLVTAGRHTAFELSIQANPEPLPGVRHESLVSPLLKKQRLQSPLAERIKRRMFNLLKIRKMTIPAAGDRPFKRIAQQPSHRQRKLCIHDATYSPQLHFCSQRQFYGSCTCPTNLPCCESKLLSPWLPPPH
jgi:hypothetical protein